MRSFTGKPESGRGWLLAVTVVSVLLAVFLLLLVGLVFAKRRHAQKKTSEVIQKQDSHVNIKARGPDTALRDF
ncbi:unnamed protein product [Boreogadus saida]